MKPFIQDGHSLALRAVRALIGPGTHLVVEAIATVDWASATFVGKRHRCELRVEGARPDVERALRTLACDLSEIDMSGCGHFLADCILDQMHVVSGAHGAAAEIIVEALTIEE